ncbi:ChaN family lipoprotein, partial [Pararhodobacter marinus]
MPALLRAEPIPQSFLDRLPPAQILVLGEVHDNPQHHRNQARAIRAQSPAAVVWEMLTP